MSPLPGHREKRSLAGFRFLHQFYKTEFGTEKGRKRINKDSLEDDETEY